MRLNQKINIHNRFDIEVRDAKTNELKGSAVAYNILLDQIYTRLCAGNPYFVNIHFGTGTGAPSANRTSLFNHLGTKVGEVEEIIKSFPVSSCKKKITLVPSEYVGANITEVGIAFGNGTTQLVTHAMLKDSEGNSISISKTSTDTVIIYATFFITLTNNYKNFILLNMPDGNSLLNYLVSGASAPVGAFKLKQSLYEDDSFSLATTANAIWTSDVVNRQRRTDIKRFDISDGNGHVQALEFSNMFRIGFPAEGVHAGQPYAGVHVGIGDGLKQKFLIPSDNLLPNTLGIFINGVLNTAYNILDDVGSSAVTIKQPPNVPNGGYSVSLSADGDVLALGSGSTSPYLRVWDWSGTEWILRPQPPNVPSNGYSVSLSADGDVLALGSCTTSPYLRVWDWSGTEWILRPQPPNVPSNGNSVSLSADGDVLALGSGSTSPYLRVWSRRLTSSTIIEFETAPAEDDVITANYTVKGVHKTVNSVIDTSFAIQFGEGI